MNSKTLVSSSGSLRGGLRYQTPFIALCLLLSACSSNESTSGGMGGFAGGASPGSPQPKKVQVFILAGDQSMEGQGFIPITDELDAKNGGQGTLEYLREHEPKTYEHLGKKDRWVYREDVWITSFKQSDAGESSFSQGPLHTGWGRRGDQIGPELQFGNVVGDFYDAPVLLIKVAKPSASLGVDFLPPSAGGPGPAYTWLVDNVHTVLDDILTYLPNCDDSGLEIVGVAWNQGFNDRKSGDSYEENCVHFINDLRAEFGLPELPFVLATTGIVGNNDSEKAELAMLVAGQLAVPTNSGLKAGLVSVVPTSDFWRDTAVSPGAYNHFWNQNAESYYLIGDSMGHAMIKLTRTRL